MRHHVYRVHQFAGLDLFEARHHRVGNIVGALRPGIDHLVVFLALGNEAVLVLLFVLLDLVLGIGNQLLLGRRNDEVVLAERNAGLAGIRESEAHHAVGKDHGVLLPAMAIDEIDHVLNVFLGQDLVENVERHARALRQDMHDEHAARRRFHTAHIGLAVFVDRLDPHLDLGVQGDHAP